MPNSRKQNKFCFTFFDYEDWTPPLDSIDNGRIRYLCFGEEKCPTTDKMHLQGYIVYKAPISMADAMAIDFDSRASLRVARGNTTQNIEYCSKDGIFQEWGERPADDAKKLDELVNDLRNGSTTMERLLYENPMAVFRYGRVLEQVAGDVNRRIRRTAKPTVYWLWGPTGVGKTTRAEQLCNEETYEWRFNDANWQDGYNGEKHVILDDFRGQLAYDELLRMLGHRPYFVPRRGKAPYPFLATLIVITSALKPEECYRRRNINDNIAQLIRRIDHLTEVTGWVETPVI